MKPLILALIFILAPQAQALETISSEALVALCQSESASDVAECTAYINGFLDGAFATDPRVAENVLNELRQQESFSERAMRTRLGRAMDRFGPSFYAGFCIPTELPVATIRKALQDSTSLHSAPSHQHNARDFLYQLLQTTYPCQ